jgi:hypothetical protein
VWPPYSGSTPNRAGLAVAEVGVGVPVVTRHDPVASLELDTPSVNVGGPCDLTSFAHANPSELVEHI